ncbi:MAG TPA: SDR family oxidoreductase [Spirochaetia bacterium]|nr:SDR family oxidoreductase [Spirochaetia bacterium]
MRDTVKKLDGKVAVVTGAGKGIGKAVAIGFGREGGAVCCAARTAADIEDTVKTILREGGRGLAVPTDVTKPDEVERLFQNAKGSFGGIDIVFINAGGNLDRSRVEDGNAQAWAATVELNLIGSYYCAKASIPYLKERGGGRIITMGSGIGHAGMPGSSAYSCAKAGLWMLTRVLAEELWPYKISVNELIPGPVKTVRNSDLIRAKESVFGIESEWIKTPEEVVPLAVFLASHPEPGPTAQSFSLMRRKM